MWICWTPSRALAAISSISSDERLTLETSANTLFTAFSISTSTLRWYIVHFTAMPTQTKTTVVLTGTSIPLYYSYDWLLLLIQKPFLNYYVKEISLKSLLELPESPGSVCKLTLLKCCKMNKLERTKIILILMRTYYYPTVHGNILEKLNNTLPRIA